ncbi:MAG: hypothetical protein WCE63_13290 [Acidobacteriaceae bacterium]
MHNDDTGMKVLKLEREPGDKRTGVFTSGIVSAGQGRKIALYFTGRQHAGENIADVLKHRAAELLCPIQMCDASASRLTDLIAQAKARDPLLGADLDREFKVLSSRLPFGLNFERHRLL